MKRTRIIPAAVAAVLALGSAASVIGEDNITVTLDGKAIEFDVQPCIVEERTLVPVRKIFEALGATVDWDQDAQTVTAEKNGTVINLVIGDKMMSVDGVEHELDVPPQIVDERTLVPVRAISESFGCTVDWDQETQTVIIVSGSEASQIVVAPGPVVQETESPIINPMNPGPAVPTTTSSPEPAATATAAPEATATTVPTATPAATAAAAEETELPFTYDKTNETKSANVSQFKVTSCTKTETGKYAITYSLETFFEGRGTVSATFNCLDANGKVVDTFGGTFNCTDYTWTKHEGETAEISADTVKIELAAK